MIQSLFFKNFILSILALCCTSAIKAQTIQEIFRNFPLEYSMNLTASAKDSLIAKGTYTINEESDSLEWIVDLNCTSPDHIELTYHIKNGPSGFVNIELRRFQKKNDENILLWSKMGGEPKSYDQHKLVTFRYDDDKFVPDSSFDLPETITSSEFKKTDYLQSTEQNKVSLNTGYDLNPDKPDSIEYFAQGSEELMEYEKFIYTWNGERFIKSRIKI